MTIDLGLRFVAKNSEGTQNKMYVDDLTSYTENDVSLGFVITLGDTIVYQDSVGTFSLNGKNQTLEVSAPTTDGFPTNGTYTVYVRIQDNETLYITTGTKSFVLNYTAPTNLLSIVVDGYSSTITDRDSYDYANLTVNSYELRHVDPNAVESTSATQTLLISPTIYAGTHTLYLTADITWEGTDVSLNDYVTHSTTAVAYKLDEDTIMEAVDALKESYRVNLQVNRSEARSQRLLIDEIDLYEDDYWVAVRRNDKLTAYISLLKIYDLLNETLVTSGQIPVYESITELVENIHLDYDVVIDRLDTAEGNITTNANSISSHVNSSDAHSISQITGLQSALDGYLSSVSIDTSLVGDGTVGNPLGHNPVDTTIIGLNSVTNGGEVPDVDYNWFKGLYASLVDSSVKSWIIGIVTYLKSLADRVSILENDIVNYSITVPSDVAAVDIENINAPKGSVIHLAVDFVYSLNTPTSTYNMLFNNITSGYRNAGVSANNSVILYAPLSEGAQYVGSIIVADAIVVFGATIRKTIGSNPAQLTLTSSLPNFSNNSLTKITIRTTESGKVIAAGTKINVKIVR